MSEGILKTQLTVKDKLVKSRKEWYRSMRDKRSMEAERDS